MTFLMGCNSSGSSPLSRGILKITEVPVNVVRIIPALAGNTRWCARSCADVRDHPRSRGEYSHSHTPTPTRSGSSPLSRGIPVRERRDRRSRRIIPALAGNTRSGFRLAWQWRDHPRSRGEYTAASGGGTPPLGSSPLSRGILHRFPGDLEARGIIPALAGNTVPGRGITQARTDHPRSRGEYNQYNPHEVMSRGSSPLSRGIQPSARVHGESRGIIPALAGNTEASTSALVPVWDHPRSRGEYELAGGGVYLVPGSSPLSRGILDRDDIRTAVARIIPALAGNTLAWLSVSFVRSDHPRSRGEYFDDFDTILFDEGSSPLSRGIRRRSVVHLRGSRIIPALAGNTTHRTSDHSIPPDHPRSRGEYSMPSSASRYSVGSSPLSRGILRLAYIETQIIRIIPALAGNTPHTATHSSFGRDHPRSRGEYRGSSKIPSHSRGSSPLSRGIPRRGPAPPAW